MHILKNVMSNDELARAHLLVFANKQDLPGARSIAEIVDKLRLRNISGVASGQRQWHVQACCAVTGDGLTDGLDWLATKLRGK